MGGEGNIYPPQTPEWDLINIFDLLFSWSGFDSYFVILFFLAAVY